MVDNQLGMVNKVKELPIESMPWKKKGHHHPHHPRGHPHLLHFKRPVQVAHEAMRWREGQDACAPPRTLPGEQVQENSASR